MNRDNKRNIQLKRDHIDIIIIVIAWILVFISFFMVAVILRLRIEGAAEESSNVFVHETSLETDETDTTRDSSGTYTEEEQTTAETTTTEVTGRLLKVPVPTTTRQVTSTLSSCVTAVKGVSSSTAKKPDKKTDKKTGSVQTKETTAASTVTTTNVSPKVSSADIALLRKLVANEYGADWVPVTEKAKIVACVMSQVKDKRFPNTVKGCIYKTCVPYGFNPSKKHIISDSVIAAVDYYFNNESTVFANWTANSWWGDGKRNHFRRT